MALRISSSRVLAAAAVAALGVLFVGWLDNTATRRDLLNLLRQQAVSLQQTVAAAARSNQVAGQQAQAQVTERLLDNLRLLAELDRLGGLSQESLTDIAARNRLFRVAVFGAKGERELATRGPGGGPGGGQGGGQGFGRGGFSGGTLLQNLLEGTQVEAVGQMHTTPWGDGARIAAGIRRSSGGAILVNADASEIGELLRQVSLDSLVQEIAKSTPELAYVIVSNEAVRIAHGSLVDQAPPDVPVEGGVAGELAERELAVGPDGVLEFAGALTLSEGPAARLRMGLRLDTLRAVERRLAWRMTFSLAAALLLSLLALGTVWLRQAYATLSEKHKLAEEALRRRDRLSAMGELASTVAHEVRNPLNAIAMSGQRLRREFLDAVPADTEDRAELQQLLAIVEGETRRIDDIVRQFLEFARPPTLAVREADLGGEVTSMVEAVRSLAASRGVTLELDAATAGLTRFDPTLLRQAIDNLLRNAIEATPPGGTVSVTARTGAREQVIEVRDTGAGIDADVLPRIFDLYFTTKAEGTGVGLAVTQQIVSAHGGTIEVESQKGAGTRMSVRLPAVIAEVERV
jgi:signal transduction histidine kinase